MKFSTTLLAASFVVSLAACGGGSGQYSASIPQQTPSSSPVSGEPTPPSETSPAPVSTPTPPPGTSPAPSSSPGTGLFPSVTTDSGQQAETLQGASLLSMTGSLTTITNALNVPSVSAFGAHRLAAASLRRLTAGGGCANQETETQTTSNAMTTFVIKGYPNASCSGLPEYQMDMNVYANGSASYLGNGLESFYDPATGGTLAQNTVQYFSVSPSGMQIEGSFAAYTAKGVVTSAYGLTCVGTACSSATAIDASVADASFGSVISTSGCSGCTTVLAYVAPLDDLSVQLLGSNVAGGTPPFYQIDGGTDTDNVTLTVTSNGYDMVDKTNGAEVRVTTAAGGAATGVVLSTSNGKQLASFSMDQFGAGTLTMSDGSQMPIAGFMVL